MEFSTLGRTGLRVSRMGLGCGGHSRLGQATGNTEDQSIRVVQEAIDLGINFIDTAEGYGTEVIVGKAIQGRPRDEVLISTKVHVECDGKLSPPAEYRERFHGCLQRLQTDYIDVFHIHGLVAKYHPFAISELVPVLRDLQAEGKIRFIGVTEAFGPDPTHEMLKLAAADDCWDVIMVGFNILNQSARERVLTWTREKNVGTLGMFAVRRALSHPERLRELIKEMAESGLVNEKEFDMDDPLGFLTAPGVAESVTEAAYRFCLHEPGIDLVLSGTGNVAHVRDNANYLSQPPLPEETSARLRALFQGIDTISGN